MRPLARSESKHSHKSRRATGEIWVVPRETQMMASRPNRDEGFLLCIRKAEV